MTAQRTSASRISAVFLAIGLTASLVGCINNGSNEPDSPEMSPPAAAPSAEAPAEEVTMDEAARIATDKYGGNATSVEDDSYKGEPAWEVEIKDSTEGRIEVKVSKTTGDILDMEHDY